MKVTINPECFKILNGWLKQSYSPNFTNAHKVLSNLRHIGDISRREWLESYDILCDAAELYDLTHVSEISVEKIRYNRDYHLVLDLSFSMASAQEESRFASFVVDSSLNILSHDVSPRESLANYGPSPFFPVLDECPIEPRREIEQPECTARPPSLGATSA